MKLLHGTDKQTLLKQKIEQLKTKYKIKVHNLKDDLKSHKKHHESEKVSWNEQKQALQRSLNVIIFGNIYKLGTTSSERENFRTIFRPLGRSGH